MAKRIPRHMEMAVSNQMFLEFREEIKSHLTSVKLEIRADLKEFGARQDRFEATLSSLKSEFHQVRLLVETQTRQNQIALDGVRHCMEELIGLRTRVDKLS